MSAVFAVDHNAAGVFEPEMKALNLMRWIRQYIAFLHKAIDDQEHHRRP